MAVLDVIRRRPATRAADLAAEEFGRERDPFKIDVRKLKNLGLTHSLEVGYELSPARRGVPPAHHPVLRTGQRLTHEVALVVDLATPVGRLGQSPQLGGPTRRLDQRDGLRQP